jgi:hypothetical protein
MRSAAAVLCAILIGVASSANAVAATCRLHTGDKVVLYSASGVPSVFVWDSPVRLRDYNAASYDEAQAMSVRATLVAPGTRALVASCRANFIQSPYSDSPDDAVGITIITGPERGHNYWVLGSDIRGVYHPQKPKNPNNQNKP